MDAWIRIEGIETNRIMHASLIHDEVIAVHWRKDQPYNKWCWKDPCRLKNKIISLPCTIHKNQFLAGERINCERISIELLEDYVV